MNPLDDGNLSRPKLSAIKSNLKNALDSKMVNRVRLELSSNGNEIGNLKQALKSVSDTRLTHQSFTRPDRIILASS